MRNYKITGLTGPSGSGKSVFTEELKPYGYAVVCTDKLAHKVLNQNEFCKKNLADVFGYDIINEYDEIDRKKLASRAFHDTSSASLLNAITHPYILTLTLQSIQEYISEGYQKIILDAPLLFESNAHFLCDTTAAVISSLEIRKLRLITRDGLSEEQVFQRIKNQQPDDYYIKRSDIVIYNNESFNEFKSAIQEIIKIL